MFKVFEFDSTYGFSSLPYIDAIAEVYEAVIPQAIYDSHKAKIHINDQRIAIDFIHALHESVIRYEFSLPHKNAFGNGKHPTTLMCLELLAELLHTDCTKHRQELRMLDVGTGTGILAIAAAVMGVNEIDAFDASVHAYECARANIEGKYPIHLICCDLKQFTSEKQYDIITANLMTSLIIANAGKLSSLLQPNGYCIVSGIIDERKHDVIQSFKEFGCVLKDEQITQGWFAGVFQKR